MGEHLSIDSGAFYSIQFQGSLDQSWADEFGNLQVIIHQRADKRQPQVTTVVGEIVDQAALTGLLSLAYNLGMPLLSVTYLGRP